jgi:hypothetical protein
LICGFLKGLRIFEKFIKLAKQKQDFLIMTTLFLITAQFCLKIKNGLLSRWFIE